MYPIPLASIDRHADRAKPPAFRRNMLYVAQNELRRTFAVADNGALNNLDRSTISMPDKRTGVESEAAAKDASTVSQLIDAKIASLGGWRGDTLSRIRHLIHESDPDVIEEVKWRKPSNPSGVPVWSHAGILCTGETYRDKVKLTFANGASLADPSGLFNSSLEGKTRRAIDIHDGDQIDATAFKDLIRAAVALNTTQR